MDEPGVVLIVTPTGRDGPVAAEVLGKAGIHSEICANLEHAASRIGTTTGVALISEEALRTRGLDRFRETLRAQEPWSDLPIVLLTGSGASTFESTRALDLLDSSTALTLLERPFRSVTLVTTVQTALRSRQRQIQVRDLLLQRDAALAGLRATKAELEAANAAKDHFLATLSHELRTPLTPVLMCIAEDAEDPDLPEKFRENLRMIHRNIELEARLIDDLLDLTRIVRGKLELRPEIVDLHLLLRAALDVCSDSETNRRQLTVSTEMSATDHHVWGDAARLQQVFWNLFKNAIKFTPDHGRISARSWNPRAGIIAVEIRDTGIGLERGKLPRIFDAFEQGDRAITRRFGGLGLGLAICKAIVSQHDGEIRASSDGLNRGTAFTVELATTAPPQPPGSPPQSDKRRESPSCEILLVEDHASTLQILTGLLTRAGHKVRTAKNLAEACFQLTTHHFDLLITDLGLPDGNGLSLVRHIQQRNLRSIALSGFGMDDDVRICREAGFDEHMTKPVDWDRLKAVIQRLISEKA